MYVHNKSLLYVVSVYIFLKFLRVHQRRVLKCTSGSQQPNSRWPSPDTALAQPLGSPQPFDIHPDNKHLQPRPPFATRCTVRKDGTVALRLGPNLDEDTKQR